MGQKASSLFDSSESSSLDVEGILGRSQDNRVIFCDEDLEEIPIKKILKQVGGEYSNLTDLDLSENNIATITKDLFKFNSLKSLNLSENRIEKIPEDIKAIYSLETLVLIDNKLDSLPKNFSSLINLTSLDLSANDFVQFPNVFSLKNLSELILQENKIEVIPPKISQLNNLVTLEMNKNLLKKIPDELCKCSLLEELDFTDNQIEEISDQIGNLKRLLKLDVPSNNLTKLPSSIGDLVMIQELDLSQNKFQHLPFEIGKLKTLNYLKVDSWTDDLLTPPPFMIEEGEKYMIDYLEQCLINNAQFYSRQPLLLLGESRSGKTKTLEALKGTKIELKGLSIEELKIQGDKGETIFTTYDFENDDTFYALHRFFMNKISLYLITIDLRKSLDVDYWMRLLTLYSKHSRVIIVGTHPENLKFEDPTPIYSKKYKNFECFITLPLNNTESIDKLRSIIYETSLKMKNVRFYVPNNYFKMIDIIKNEKNNFCDLKYISELTGLKNDISIQHFLGILHHWGIIYYPKPKGGNKNFIILKPQWLSDVISAVVSSKKDIINGFIDHNTLETIWGELCPIKEHRQHLIGILQKYEFMFQTGIRNSLIPVMIPSSLPHDVDLKKELTIGKLTSEWTYTFDVIPLDFLSRFYVRISKYSRIIYVWSKGTLIENEDRALIVNDENKVIITVNGIYPKNLMSIITNIMDTMIKEYNTKLKCEITISCPNCLSNNKSGVFILEEIEKIKEERYKLECKVCENSILIDEIFDNNKKTAVIKKIIGRSGSIKLPQTEFIHRQFLSLNQMRHQKEIPIIIPQLNEKKLTVYFLCEHIGHWHFVENAHIELNEDEYLKLMIQSNTKDLEEYISLLIELLESCPPLKIPKDMDWSVTIQNCKNIMKKISEQSGEKSFFEGITISKLSLVKTPTLEYPLYLCDEHRKWFEQESFVENELTSSSITILKEISKGAFSRVVEGLLFNRIKVAVKILPIEDQNIKSEISILRKLFHDNIVLYYGAYSSEKAIYIVMEYVENKTLREIIKKCKLTNDKNYKKHLKKRLIAGIASGMEYLHSKNIIHRDLKPENILISSNEIPKVSDFGLSKILIENEKMSNSQTGTAPYMAVEILNGEEEITSKVDVYSFGIMLWELYSETEPFLEYKKNNFLMWKKVKEGERPKVDETSENIPIDVMKIINLCWAHSANDRPTFKDLIKMIEEIK